MQDVRTVMLSTSMGQSLEIPLAFDGERESAEIRINGTPYHFERIYFSQLLSEYRIDNDPDYQPVTDADGYCYIIAPFSK